MYHFRNGASLNIKMNNCCIYDVHQLIMLNPCVKKTLLRKMFTKIALYNISKSDQSDVMSEEMF